MKHAPLTLAIGLAIGLAATLPAKAQELYRTERIGQPVRMPWE